MGFLLCYSFHINCHLIFLNECVSPYGQWRIDAFLSPDNLKLDIGKDVYMYNQIVVHVSAIMTVTEKSRPLFSSKLTPELFKAIWKSTLGKKDLSSYIFVGRRS